MSETNPEPTASSDPTPVIRNECPFPDGSFDAGLYWLKQVAGPEEEFELHAIAEVCGCSHEWIRKIEERALRKAYRLWRQAEGLVGQKGEFSSKAEEDAFVRAVYDTVDAMHATEDNLHRTSQSRIQRYE